MDITMYQPAPVGPDERRREQAVVASGAIAIRRDPALDALVRDLRRSLRVTAAAVTIVHGDWQYLIAADGVSDGPYSRRTSFCGHAIERPDRLFFIPDALEDARFAGNPVVEEGNLRFYAAAPLVRGDRLPLGAVCVFDGRPRPTLDPTDARRRRR